MLSVGPRQSVTLKNFHSFILSTAQREETWQRY
jgi:hypothetical protein